MSPAVGSERVRPARSADWYGLTTAEPVDWRQHTMGDSLLRYLEIKVHSLVQQDPGRPLLVVGQYDRSQLVSANEKNDKMFNWQRPTVRVVGDEIVVQCFPGRDYVLHYALILATYLEMTGRYDGQVRYVLPDPAVCDAMVDRLQLDLSAADLVVVGWGLTELAGSDGWTSGPGCAWKRCVTPAGTIVHLGFRHSIWGDVAGRVVRRLAALGASRVVYVGKVGGLDPAMTPNRLLATGDESVLGARRVRWRDVFDDELRAAPEVVTGRHVTSPSILLEGRRWLDRQQGNSFVDPEIGPMGAAADAAGIAFGYLHIVSNNLARSYAADLSNERRTDVLRHRAQLLGRIRQLLAANLARSTGGRGGATSEWQPGGVA